MPRMPTAMVAGNVLVFPHMMSDGLIRTDDEISVSVPSSFLLTITVLASFERSSSGTGMHTSTS